MTANANVQSLHDTVTARIIAELEQGRFPWVQPWASSSGGTPLGLPQNASTGRTCSGINILLLWAAAMEQGRPSQKWLTFKQALSLGGNVRKGEKGTMVVYADTFVPKAEQEKASASGEEVGASGSSSGSLSSMSISATDCQSIRMPHRFLGVRKSCHRLKIQNVEPQRIVTDGLRSYGAAHQKLGLADSHDGSLSPAVPVQGLATCDSKKFAMIPKASSLSGARI